MVSVTSIQAATVFAWFMFLMVIRRIVLLVLAFIFGYNKPLSASSRAPEDRMFRGEQVEPSTVSHHHHLEFTREYRVRRTIENDTENDVYFFILLFSTAAFSDSVSGNCTRTIIYGCIYLFFRLCYALTYILALQPWRTFVFSLSFACIFSCSFDFLITMSRRSN